jgi:hypothetical protein
MPLVGSVRSACRKLFGRPPLDPQKLKGVKDRSMGAYVVPGGNMHHDRDFKKPKP